MAKPNILVRFTDESETVMSTYMGQIEDATLIYASDPRYKEFYDSLNEFMRYGMPEPVSVAAQD